MPQDKLKQLKDYLTVINGSLTKEEFTKAFSAILDFVKKLAASNLKEFEGIQKVFRTLSDKLSSDTSSSVSELKKSFGDFTRSAITKIDQKLGTVVNGRDGEQGPQGIQGLQGEKGDNGSPDTADQIIDKISGLLEIKDIKGLKDELEKLRKIKGGTTIMGGNLGGHVVKTYDLSALLNGVLKTFSLPAFWRVIDVKLSSIPTLRPTTDYTTDSGASTITFTSQINASTELSAGQSCIVIYSE